MKDKSIESKGERKYLLSRCLVDLLSYQYGGVKYFLQQIILHLKIICTFAIKF